jgi:hypothetical protein
VPAHDPARQASWAPAPAGRLGGKPGRRRGAVDLMGGEGKRLGCAHRIGTQAIEQAFG